MSRIILIDNLNEDNADKLDEIMSSSFIKYKISVQDKCLIIYGDSDDVYQTKQLIQDEGFIIK